MYKRFLILFSLYLISTNVFSQKLGLASLPIYNQMAFEDFDSDMKQKVKYQFKDKIEYKTFTLYRYNNFTKGISRNIDKIIYPNDVLKNRLEYSTTDKIEFENNLQWAVKLGYKLLGKGKIKGGSTYTDFKKENSKLRFVVPQKEVATGSVTVIEDYTIIVSN
jgi:hypothetical protein